MTLTRTIMLFLVLALLFAFLMVALQPILFPPLPDPKLEKLREIMGRQRNERKNRPTETVAACELGVCA